jgi:hypothetical protein
LVEIAHNKVLYIFLDEGGNFDFSISGTKFLTFSALSKITPLDEVPELSLLKYSLWRDGHELERFHATEDLQFIRDSVFQILCKNLSNYRLDTVVIEKRKTNPMLQSDMVRFYRTMFKILMDYIDNGYAGAFDQIIVVTDTLPTGSKNANLTKALKLELSVWAKNKKKPYKIFHFSSASDVNLQMVDYLNWAVYVKWEISKLQIDPLVCQE